MKTIHALIAVLTVAFLLMQPVRAQQKDPIEKPPAPTGFRGEFIGQLNDVEKKIEELAGAMPENSYSWRPMEGVRSVSEVYMHIAGANYLFPTFIGVKKPEGLEKNLEKNVTEKAKVIQALKVSFNHLRTAVLQTPDSDLDKATKMFGDDATYRGVIFEAALHLHEHLGQSIAYARMNKVVPPWTAAEQAAEKDAKKDTKK
ncbi:MAG TPA: DinB family protein [Bacteroidota bacterium]|jgi:uncharacterized damage-inducible protein DinB